MKYFPAKSNYLTIGSDYKLKEIQISFTFRHFSTIGKMP